MRRQGKIVEWNDMRGFGFVLLNGSDERAFAHISDFSDRQVRPGVGDVVTYDVVTERGRPKATAIVHAGAAAKMRQRPPPPVDAREHLPGSGWLGGALLVTVTAVFVWHHDYRRDQQLADARKHLAQVPAASVDAPVISDYRCSGKQHCSQMASCDEARFYLAHCPDTKMDGDADGRPCEDKCR